MRRALRGMSAVGQLSVLVPIALALLCLAAPAAAASSCATGAVDGTSVAHSGSIGGRSLASTGFDLLSPLALGLAMVIAGSVVGIAAYRLGGRRGRFS
jgi:hypothetical protein